MESTTTTTTTAPAPSPCRVCGEPVPAERVAAVGAVCAPAPYRSVFDTEPRCVTADADTGATGTVWPRPSWADTLRELDRVNGITRPADCGPTYSGRRPTAPGSGRGEYAAASPAPVRSALAAAIRRQMSTAPTYCAAVADMMAEPPAGRSGRVPVTLDGDPWPLRGWRQTEERGAGAVADAYAAVFRAIWIALTGTALAEPERPIVWREALRLPGAGRSPAGAFTFTTDDGETVTVAEMPLSLDTARGVRPAPTPALVALGIWPRGYSHDGPVSAGPVAWSGPGEWALVPGEYPAPIDVTAPGRTTGTVLSGSAGAARRSAGRVPRRTATPVGEALGAKSLTNMTEKYPEHAAALAAVPAPRKSGDAAEDKREGSRYRAALRRAAGLK